MSQILTSSEMFINMKDVPYYDPRKNYFDQSKDVLQFYEQEFRKIREGVNIGGYFVHPWMYYHVNFFKTPIPQPDKTEPIMCPLLDDNFIYTVESYQEAEETNKGVCLFGTRGGTKSTLLTSLSSWTATKTVNGVTSIVGGSEGDLKAISGLLEKNFNNINPAFYMPKLKADWDSLVEFGVKEKTGHRFVHSQISITNANKGTAKAGEKGAGLSPVGYIMDEIGKYDCKAVLNSALPSFRTQYGSKLVHFLSGCVCAGTKVWNNSGELVNIEDLDKSKGILGYDIENKKVSQEDITYWQPPHEKECFRIETVKGRHLECSHDHPILKRKRYPSGTFKKGIEFCETDKLEVGDSIAVVENLDEEKYWGKNKMFDPWLIGLLIGDGVYSATNSAKLINADKDVLNKVKNKYPTRVNYEAPTKDGRTLEKLTISGITGELRKLGIKGQARDTKRLPINIDGYRKSDILKLLGGLYDADGCYYVSSNTPPKRGSKVECLIKLTSCQKELLEQVRYLLHKIGVHSNLVYEKLTENSSPKSTRGHYNLIIKDSESMVVFSNNIKPVIKYKKKKLKEIQKIQENHTRTRKVKTEHNLRFERIKSITSIGKKPVYNLTAGTTHTYIANGIVTHNTGGNKELSQDAKDILSDPEAFDLIMMNWDRLDRSVPEEAITWTRSKTSKFSMFVPGQMSYRLSVPKLTSNLQEVTGIQHKDLKKIEVKVTDWIKATKEIKDKNKTLKEEEERQKNQMYYPLETADCFLTRSNNPFPTAVISRHIRKLEDEGKTGKDISIYNEGSKFKYELVSKQRAEVSHKGGVADAPIILHSEFPENERPPRGLYVSGLDGYKLDVSETDSLGSFYIIKRRNQEPNEPCEKIVASYTARPEKMRDFNATCEKMSDVWNAECLMESIDLSFKQHLEQKGREYDILAPAITFAGLTSKRVPQLNSKFGLYPNTGNNQHRFNLLVEMTKEEHTIGVDDDGNVIVKLGVEFIDDLDLLREMLNWFKGGNFDRITAFSHALVMARELDKKHINPDRLQKNTDKISAKEMSRRAMLTGRNPYGMTRGSKY